MKTITINIECDEKTCGNCHGLGYADLLNTGYDCPVCGIFSEDLTKGMGTEVYRCRKCVEQQ